jgi:hypothetical protein
VIGLGPPRPAVLPEGFEVHPDASFWWMEREVRYRRRMAVQYTPAIRFFERNVSGLYTCENLHPNIREGEQCGWCGTKPEFHILDFESEAYLDRWLADSWNTPGPHSWKESSWEAALAWVLKCPAGTYSELIYMTNSERRAKYGAAEFPPEQDNPLEEQLRLEEKARNAASWAEYDALYPDTSWDAYDRWEEEQRTKRERTNPSPSS